MRATTKTTATQPKPNERLELYSNLFEKGKNKLCENTGLQLISSLNYSLQTFLYTCDTNWVLAMIEIDQVENIIDKLGQSLAKRKFIQVGSVIKNFCENDTSKLKGFKLNDNNNDDQLQPLYSILMYCHPNLNKSEKYIIKLMKKIKQQTNLTVSIGIAKMNEWETFEEWKNRSLQHIVNVHNGKNNSKEKKGSDAFYSDIDIKYVDPTINTDDEKMQAAQRQQPQAKKLGARKEFENKMQEIANNEDYDWMIAIMEIDAFELEIDKIEKEMFHLFDIYGNDSGNQVKYFGYNLSRDNDIGQFGLVLYDSKDINECLIPAHEIIETLKEEISMKYQFTLSIGCSRLIEDDLGMSDDWFERINDNLKQAKHIGGNQVCFGNNNDDGNNDDVELKLDEFNLYDTHNDDKILKKSLQGIEVRYVLGFVLIVSCNAIFLFVLFFAILTIQEHLGAAGVNIDAAIDFEKVNITVNTGKLVNENDIDVKYDYDPSKTLAINVGNDITFKQIFLEVVKFIQDNNDQNEQYLEYPKSYLNSKNPKCQNKQSCKQCYDDESSTVFIFSMCSTTRRHIANQLFDIGQERQCITDSLSTTAKRLYVPDHALVRESYEYKLNSDWFAKVYSFLTWQQEVVGVILHDLARLSEDEVEQSEFVFKFDFFMSLHSYLDKLVEYLVLFYCCFDTQSWIATFYPFIETALGTSHCSMLFAQRKTNSRPVPSICNSALKMCSNEEKKEEICIREEFLREMKGISIFQRLLCDVYQIHENDIIGIMNNPFDLCDKICARLKQMVNNIKTQLVIDEMVRENLDCINPIPYTTSITAKISELMNAIRLSDISNVKIWLEENKNKPVRHNLNNKNDVTDTRLLRVVVFVRLLFDLIFFKHVLNEPCILACSENNMEILELLLKYGANPGATQRLESKTQVTTLYWAAYHKNKPMMKLLINYGLDCKKMINTIHYDTKYNYSVFLYLCHNGDVECMKYLTNECKQNKVKINIQQTDIFGRNGLYIAVSQQHVLMVSYLLEVVYGDAQIKMKIMNQRMKTNDMHLSELAAQLATSDALSIFKLLIDHKCPMTINTDENCSSNDRKLVIESAASCSRSIFDFMLNRRLYPNLVYLTDSVVECILLNGTPTIIFDNILLVAKHLASSKKSIPSNDEYKTCVMNVLYNIMFNGSFDVYFAFIKQLICILLNTNNWKHFTQIKLIDKHLVNQLLSKLSQETNADNANVDKSWCQLLKKINDSFDNSDLLDEYNDNDDNDNGNESKENENYVPYYCNENHLMSKTDNIGVKTATEKICILCTKKSTVAMNYQCVECCEYICCYCDNKFNQLTTMLKRKQFEQFEEKIDNCDKKSKMLKLVEILFGLSGVVNVI